MGLEGTGIDARVAAVLEAQGIQSLYPPQQKAWEAVRSGRNTIVAIPTASGKSLVAYLAILHRWLATGKKALYIVPLRALASEKYDELREFRSLGLTVGISTGDLDEKDPRLGRFDVIVLTSEKADAFLRHRSGWLEEVGCVVADELHLLNDAGRGPTLEVILSRFRDLIPQAQIVGLSATVQNSPDVARWLDAHLVQSDWRPTKLKVGTYFGDRLEFLGEAPQRLEAAGDPVASLVEQTVKDGGQCLVFVSTRRAAEAQAQRLAGLVRDLLPPQAQAALEKEAGAGGGLDDAGESSPTARKLRKLCAAGVAYHTAGLDSSQRRFVEQAFRQGRLKALCATPTLAAGVNTPARRVILRDLTRFEAGEGSRPLPVMEVKQMMGRAGRPRYDPYGEAVLLVKTEEQKRAVEEEYLHGTPEPVTSKLGADAALRIHTLASVAGGYARSEEELRRFFSRTFWATQAQDWVMRDRLDDTLAFLEDNGFLEGKGGTAAAPAYAATLFGKRTSDLYLDPLSALRLKSAMEARHEPTEFGLLEAVAGCPDILPLYLRQGDDWVQERFWPQHESILVAADGRDLETAMSYAKTAFLLQDWAAEVHMDVLEERYGIGPGDVRMRVDTAGWLLRAFGDLARALRPDWHGPTADLVLRLEGGVKQELLPLLRLRGIGRVRARTLHANGVKSPPDLAAWPAHRLAQLPGFGPQLAADLLKQVGVEPADSAGAAAAAPAGGKGKGQAILGDFAAP